MGKRGDALRAEVVHALRDAGQPQTAYDILHKLRTTNPKTAPTTVYRTLNSLADRGDIHRLESLNAYVLCQGEDTCHDAILAICDDCGTVKETAAPEVLETMASAIGKSGFAPSRHIVEVHGTCADCTVESPAP